MFFWLFSGFGVLIAAFGAGFLLLSAGLDAGSHSDERSAPLRCFHCGRETDGSRPRCRHCSRERQ